MGPETWVLQRATGEVKLRGLLDQIQGSDGRKPCQHISPDVRTDRRSAIEWPGVKKGRLRVLEAKRVFVDGAAVLNINDSPASRLFIVILFRFSQIKQFI